MTNARPSFGGIDLVSLRLLLAVADEGNLARAAARENIALSAASRRISNLELRYGVQLLHRHDRGVETSAAAEMILPRIRSILELLDQVADDLADVRDGTRGLIRLQAHPTAAAGRLPALVSEFLGRYPDIDVVIDEATSLQIVHATATGSCDLGLVSGTVPAGALELIPWSNDELVAVLPRDHPLCAIEALSLEQMLEAPFIGMQRDSALTRMFRHHAAALGRTLVERAHVSSFETAGRMVGLGLGVTILPAEVASRMPEAFALKVRPLAESWAVRPLMLCVRDRAKASAATRRLIAFLIEDASTTARL